ncbi:MAG: HAD family hydrolase [Vibrio fluvialis]
MLLGFATAASPAWAETDPLPSWNDGATKTSIIKFVEAVTSKDSAQFVPVEERIATFDNDGTLWSEQPIYFQVQFALDRVKALAPSHPDWQTEEPFASVLNGDIKHLHTEDYIKMLYATHAGMSSEEFDAIAKAWIATARHPITGKRYPDMVFQPMLELLNYLREHEFKTFIVSGGGTGFMRAWVESVYGIPPEQVIGTTFKTEFVLNNGEPEIQRLPSILVNDDKEMKPLEIYERIGRRPLAAFGNSDGDLAMLQWTDAGAGLRFPMYIHHTDEQREYKYDRQSPIGRLDKGLDEAKKRNWGIVDMKKDWRQIYPQ